jgi:hypothetical protein
MLVKTNGYSAGTKNNMPSSNTEAGTFIWVVEVYKEKKKKRRIR